MAQCMSLFLQMDRDKARQLDAKAFHEAVRKLRLSGQALLSVQEVLDEAKEGSMISYQRLFGTFCSRGWQPEIQLHHSAMEPLEGSSSHRNDYVTHTMPPRTPPSSFQPHAHSYKLEATTTTGDAFQQHLQLPSGDVPSLGVLFRGSSGNGVNVCELIRAGSRLPARGSQTFTTVVDAQVAMVMRVIAVVGGERLAIGAFELRAKGGCYVSRPKVEVVLRLDEQLVLTVSATDRSDGNHNQLVLRDARLQPPGALTESFGEMKGALESAAQGDATLGGSIEERRVNVREQRLAERQRQRARGRD